MSVFENLFGTKSRGTDEGFSDYGNTDYDESSSAAPALDSVYDGSDYSSASKAISLHNMSDSPKISILVPKDYDEVIRTAVEMLREGTIIFLNLSQVGSDVGTRIVDFMTGVAAAFEGNMKRVDNCCYAVAPKNVEWLDSING